MQLKNKHSFIQMINLICLMVALRYINPNISCHVCIKRFVHRTGLCKRVLSSLKQSRDLLSTSQPNLNIHFICGLVRNE